MRWILLVGLVLGGCAAGGGPTIGYRKGKVTGGWEAGAGLFVNDNGFAGVGVGQTWRDGKHFTYGAATGAKLTGLGDGAFGGVAASLGAGGGSDGGFSPVIGFAPLVGGVDVLEDRGIDDEGDYRAVAATFTVGVRLIAGELELFAAPKLEGWYAPSW